MSFLSDLCIIDSVKGKGKDRAVSASQAGGERGLTVVRGLRVPGQKSCLFKSPNHWYHLDSKPQLLSPSLGSAHSLSPVASSVNPLCAKNVRTGVHFLKVGVIY